MYKDRFRHARELGYRSGLEVAIARQLTEAGIQFGYESVRIPYVKPEKPSRYTPDLVLTNGIVIETKGRFLTSDRQKHQLIQAQHPDIDIRFVFANSRSRISKQSKTTYAMWCETKGFKYADKSIPSEWLAESNNSVSLAALARITGD